MNSTFSIPQSGSHIFLRVLTFAAVLTLMISSVRGAQPVFGLKQPSTVENRAELSFTSSIRTEARRKELNIDQIISQTDVQAGSWESERVSGAAAKVLESIGKMLAHADQLETHDVGPFLAEDFFCEPLRPEPLHSVYSDNCLTVFRVEKQDGSSASHNLTLVEALRSLSAPFEGAPDVVADFKIIRVETAEHTATTSALYQAAGRYGRGTVQQRSVWHCRWQRGEGLLWRLLSIRVENFEEVVNHQNRDKWFVECTPSVLGKNRCYQEQLLHGIPYWQSRIDARIGPEFRGFDGIAVGDVNGDGLQDLYLCQTGGLPNRLMLHQTDGTAADASAAAGVDFLDDSNSALLIDLDNDGDQDLVVGVTWGLLMLSNDGTGKFAVKERFFTATPAYSLAAADYDMDRDLDIYVCAYESNLHSIALPIPYHDARNGIPNLLLNNKGNWHFENVIDEVGMSVNNTRFSFAASWEDFDNDGDLDLYVANDFGRNNLYRNDGGRFTDVAASAGAEDIAAGMSVSWGDYNNDGWMDLYVSNMFSSAGRRITDQHEFQPNADSTTIRLLQRHTRGNTLLENTGNGTFRDVSDAAAVAMGRWAWGSLFMDLNNDGWEDLYVTNGFATQEDRGDL